MKKINIGLFCPEPKFWMGGVNYYLRLCQVVSLYPNNISFTVFVSKNTPQYIIDHFLKIPIVTCVKINSVKQSTSDLLKAIILGMDYNIKKMCDLHKIDILIENASFFGWRKFKPIISWIPDLQHAFLPEFFSKKNRLKRDLGFYFQSIFSTLIFVSSNDTKNNFLARYKISDNKKVRVVPFSVPTIKIDEIQTQKVLDLYNITNDFIYLPNQYWPHKNFELVIEAINLIKKNNQKPIQIISSGSNSNLNYYNKIESLKEKYAITDNEFKYLGFIPNEHVATLIQASKALLNPSKFEGWSTTVEEAKSYNKFMFLSDIAIHHEQAEFNAKFFNVTDHAQLSKYICQTYQNIKPSHTYIENDLQDRFYNEFYSMIIEALETK
ncbi:glycosyltransferase [Providencia rettgeri]